MRARSKQKQKTLEISKKSKMRLGHDKKCVREPIFTRFGAHLDARWGPKSDPKAKKMGSRGYQKNALKTSAANQRSLSATRAPEGCPSVLTSD